MDEITVESFLEEASISASSVSRIKKAKVLVISGIAINYQKDTPLGLYNPIVIWQGAPNSKFWI